MNVKMRNAVAEDEGVHMLRLHGLFQDPREAIRKPAHGACLVVGEVAEPGAWRFGSTINQPRYALFLPWTWPA